jgi:hypothetical protein
MAMNPELEGEIASGDAPPSVDDETNFDEDLIRAGVEIHEIVGAAQLIGVKSMTFDQLMTYINSRNEYQARAYADTEAVDRSRREHELQVQSRQNDLHDKQQDANRIIVEARYRALLATILVVGVAAGVLYGLLARVPADQLSQYLAPISGLAGIVVGYLFGREAK